MRVADHVPNRTTQCVADRGPVGGVDVQFHAQSVAVTVDTLTTPMAARATGSGDPPRRATEPSYELRVATRSKAYASATVTRPVDVSTQAAMPAEFDPGP